jgi:hypothetical protein
MVCISSICFTDMKFKSHWPSVTPSARELVRFPLHVNLTVEAAFASAIAPRTSERMQIDVRHFDIATTAKGRRDCLILAKRMWCRQWARLALLPYAWSAILLIPKNLSAIHKPPADYPIFGRRSGHRELTASCLVLTLSGHGPFFGIGFQQRAWSRGITRLPSVCPAPRVAARSKTISLALPPSLGAHNLHRQGSNRKSPLTLLFAPQP